MDTNNNENIQEQIKQILSNLDGEVGRFLSQPAETENEKVPGREEINNFGLLLGITFAYKCDKCAELHVMAMHPENFVELFFGEKPAAIFENFQVGLEAAKYREQEWSKLEELMARCDNQTKALEESKKLLNKAQTLADKASIENSHLKVENDALRRELILVKTGGETWTQTALDLAPPKRRWNFIPAFKGFRLIGGGEGK